MLPKEKEDDSQGRRSDTDSSTKISSVKGRTKCFGRCLPRRTFTVTSTHVTMMSVVGTLHTSSPTVKFYKQVLYGHLCKEMRISGASHVMLASVPDLDGSFMVPNNRSLCLGHLRSGELMPLNLCQELPEGRSISLWEWTT